MNIGNLAGIHELFAHYFYILLILLYIVYENVR